MPRNGDGSSDNGPIEGHEILHGTSGDTTLQHTKHVAPMPKPESGEALPGMNASGGAAAPINDASEEFGATAPKHERLGDEDDDASTTGGTSGSGNSQSNQKSSSGGSSTTQSTKQSSSSASGINQSTKQSSSTTQTTTATHQSSSTTAKSSNELEQINREKAQRYTNLNERDVQHAGGDDKSTSEAERSKQRAPRDIGAKEDVEQLHGKATLSGNDKGQSVQQDGKSSGGGRSGSGNSEQKSGGGQIGSGSGQSGSGQSGSGAKGSSGSGKGGAEHEDHEQDPMRHNAEKFVNLEE